MRRWWLASLLMVSSLSAAEPDWNRWNAYALDLVQKYVRIPSVNPPADTRVTAKLIKGEFEKHGFAVTEYTAGPQGQTNLVIRLKGHDASKKPLLLLNHMDVVPVDAKAWRVEPFGAVVRDGFLWGRGALDMKGIGVEQMTALMALKEAGITPARDIVMLCTADEESGGEYGIKWMIAHHRAEIDAEYLLDEGGTASAEVLTPGKLVFGVAVGEKQLLWLRLRAKGTAGHGSQPIPDNANMILLTAIQKAMALPERGRPNDVIAQMKQTMGPLSDNKFMNAIQRNTISLTTLTAGVGSPVKPNVIPSASEATLDCRLLPGVNADEFLSEMKARINDPRVTVELINKSEDAGASSSTTTLFASLRKAVLAQYSAAVVSPMLIPFGTDGVYLRKQGVQAYGLNPMVIDSKIMATFHSDEERIPVDAFYKGIRIFYDILKSDF